MVLSDLIQRSESFQAERRKAEQDANRKRAAAASQQENRGNQYTAAKKVEVPPQVEATPAQHKTPTPRDHATESQRKASTALAAQVGVNRAAVERADFIRKNSPTLAQKVIDGEVPAPRSGKFGRTYTCRDSKIQALTVITSRDANMQDAVTNPDPLLTTTQASAYLQTPERTVIYWRHTNQGPSYVQTCKKRIRYRRSALEEFIASRTVTTAESRSAT